jgi:hypothetical protein
MTYGTYGEAPPGAPQSGSSHAAEQPVNPYTNQPGGPYGPDYAGSGASGSGGTLGQQTAGPLRVDPKAPVGELYGVPLTPQRILLILAVLCFGISFLGGIGGINLIALGFAFGFASFLFS